MFRQMVTIGLILFAGLAACAAEAADLSKTAAPMESPDDIEFKEGAAKVVNGPGGRKVLRFDGKFIGRMDLKSKGIEPKDHDLIKMEVKTTRAAVLLVSLENSPRPGTHSHWWVLDALRGPFDWKTIWIDLRLVEEMKEGSRIEASGPGARGLQLMGLIKDTDRKAQGRNRHIWLGRVRFCKKAVDLDWDQAKAPYTWGKGKDLVFTYPLTVTNRLNRAVTAKLSLIPFEVKEARASLSANTVELGPNETKKVEAKVILPAAIAATRAPLYCERFEARAEAEGIPDSEVTILRSSDPIHLSVTVPIPEERLQFPLYPVPKDLPKEVLFWNEDLARSCLHKPPKELIRELMAAPLYRNARGKGRETGFHQALIASAYLYHFTGEKKYFETAKKLLGALPDFWKKCYKEWSGEPVRLISHGVMEGNTLSLGWRIGGTQRPPYQYSWGGNARAGVVSSSAYAFDMLAPELDEGLKKRFIQEFLLPAAIQARNHYIGDGNQQATANIVTLYGGLVNRNWPLVSFAVTSEHGIHGITDWCFADSGRHIRNKYQTYSVQSMLWTMELLYALDIDLYRKYEDRYAKLVGHGFQHQYFWQFVKKHRLKD